MEISKDLYEALVAIVEERLRDHRVTREAFDELRGAVLSLAEAQRRTEERLGALAEAQRRTEERLGTLAEAQRRTEERLGALTEAQRRTEEQVGALTARVDQLAEAQLRTEEVVRKLAEAQSRTEERLNELAVVTRQLQEAVKELADAVDRLRKQVGGLSDTVGGDIEDIAYIVLHDVLKREFGWKVGVLERSWQTWDDEPEEVNLYGVATDPARPDQTIWIVGEAKHNLSPREVERFVRQVERARRHLGGEVFPVCFCYRARPEVQQMVREAGLRLVFSYGKLV